MAVAATGFFDGVHLGHRAVIEELLSVSRERGEDSVVVSFWPHPRNVLQDGARNLRLLTSLEEKKEIILGLGVSKVEILPFTREFSQMTAEDYIRTVLIGRYGATGLILGYDNRMGSDHLGGEAVIPVAESLGLSVDIVGPVSSDNPLHNISSTLVRESLLMGDAVGAAAMLGRPYSLYGVVVAGNRLGRTIGFPTANMQLYEPLKLIPANGVYEVEVEVLGGRFRGMTNIGVRPTVGGVSRTIETHILGFDEEIYGLPMRLWFIRKIRDEKKFPSLEKLREQLEKDKSCISE